MGPIAGRLAHLFRDCRRHGLVVLDLLLALGKDCVEARDLLLVVQAFHVVLAQLAAFRDIPLARYAFLELLRNASGQFVEQQHALGISSSPLSSWVCSSARCGGSGGGNGRLRRARHAPCTQESSGRSASCCRSQRTSRPAASAEAQREKSGPHPQNTDYQSPSSYTPLSFYKHRDLSSYSTAVQLYSCTVQCMPAPHAAAARMAAAGRRTRARALSLRDGTGAP